MTFNEYIKACVVRILTPRTGTGFCVLPGGYILTCHHVVTSTWSRTIELEYDGHKYAATIVTELSNPNKDIAVLKLLDATALSLSPVPLGKAEIDTDVRVFGYRKDFPDGYQMTGQLRPGQVLPLTGEVYNFETYLPDQTNLDGMSGSPVFDSQKKRVIGIFYGQENKGPSVSYVHSIEKAYEYWAELESKNASHAFPAQLTENEAEKSVSLFPVTRQTLRSAEEKAASEVQELKSSRDEEFIELINEKALVGVLPQWHHIYMEEFGAFKRPRKEGQVLADIDLSVKKLTSRDSGLILHVISGDSGCGKSTLSKQIIQRLVKQEHLNQFSNITSVAGRLSVFEVQQPLDWQDFERSIEKFKRLGTDDNVYLLFLDDLFSLDDKEINRIIGSLRKVADYSQIYLLVTSPSWLFDTTDLQNKKITFQLADCLETRIEGMDDGDIIALKDQYVSIYGGACRPELIEQLSQTRSDLILLKIALHHNLTYSQYFEQLFERLESKDPKTLAALLLFSTLARFYVHFPVTLLHELNAELASQDRLPESLHYYQKINVTGLRLFRIIRGSRDSQKDFGMPDTISPFHDRVAQVIYNTWGEKRKRVPIFNCRLWELSFRVYERLKANVQTGPILANVFRGHLRVANDRELDQFIEAFGPVRQNRWSLSDEPIATWRWITYSKYNAKRTGKYRRSWERVLEQEATRSLSPNLSLTLVLLSPNKLNEVLKKAESNFLEGLSPDFSPILLDILNQLLNTFPIPVEAVGRYLLPLGALVEHAPSANQALRYLTIASMASSRIIIFSKFRQEEKINQGLSNLIKAYLMRLDEEYVTNAVLIGLLRLIGKVTWEWEDAVELEHKIHLTLQQQDSIYRPILFEILLFFANIGGALEVHTIFKMLLDICEQYPNFKGLSFTASTFCSYLEWWGRKHKQIYPDTIRQIVETLTSGELSRLELTAAYPDFAYGFIDQLIFTKSRGSAEELLSFLRPLVIKFNDSPQTPGIFLKANRLHDSFFEGLLDRSTTPADRQIQLCFPQKLGRQPEVVLKEFIELLTEKNVNILSSLSPVLANYLVHQKPDLSSPEVIEPLKEQLYDWLEQNKTTREAAFVCSLMMNDLLFSPPKFYGLEEVIIENIRLIPDDLHPILFPLMYFKWWLTNGVGKTGNAEVKAVLLDSLWRYMLENSNLELPDGKFAIYENYFLFLLTHYGPEQDEVWWGESVRILIDYYHKLANEFSNRGRERRQDNRKHLNSLVRFYKKRLCLAQIMDALLKRFPPDKSHSPQNFLKSIEEALSRYRRQSWAAKWIFQLNPAIEIDGTRTFIDYLDLIQNHSHNLFEIRNQVNWWYDWSQATKQDLTVELRRVASRIRQKPEARESLLALSSLLDVTKSNSTKFAWGSVVEYLVKRGRPEFADASMLVKNYIEYINSYENSEIDELQHELASAEELSKWYLEESIKWKEVRSSAYGLQLIFKSYVKHSIYIDPVLAQNAFLHVSAAQIKYEEGGAISRYYFPWLFKQKGSDDISIYIQLLEKNVRMGQTPYILTHIFNSLIKEKVQLSSDAIERCWSLLRSLLLEQVNNEGTTIASEVFFEYLMLFESYGSIIDYVSTDFFAICQSVVNQNRTTYLITGFRPFWENHIKSPSSEEVLQLWETLLYKVHTIEAFGTLTRQLDEHLFSHHNTPLLHLFYTAQFNFIEQHPSHKLSPKFYSVLIKRQFEADKLSEALPILITSQRDLEDMDYAIIRFFKYLVPLLSREQLINVEDSIIASVKTSLYKRYSSYCLYHLIKNCTSGIHYEKFTDIINLYLEIGKPLENKNDIEKVLKAYKKYETDSNIDSDTRRSNIETFLSTVKLNSEKTLCARYLAALCNTWDSGDIPLQPAIEALQKIIIDIHPSQWERTLSIFNAFGNLFGESMPVVSGLSIQSIINQVSEHEQQGLISIKQQIGSSINQ